MDCGSFSKEIVKVVEAHSQYFYEVTSIQYTPFGGDNAYWYVVSREKNTAGQCNVFTGDYYLYRAIMTNDNEKTDLEVVLFYNDRGESERLFDEMNNDFNWNKLPFSFLHENTVFMIIMAMRLVLKHIPLIMCVLQNKGNKKTMPHTIFFLTLLQLNIRDLESIFYPPLNCRKVKKVENLPLIFIFTPASTVKIGRTYL